jgi:hypothetical protein
MHPVDTFWDLGISDKATIWFRQKIGGKYHYIHYLEDNGKGLKFYKDYLDALANPPGFESLVDFGGKSPVPVTGRGFKYGRHIWPHDGGAKDFTTGKTRQESARELGLTVEIQKKQAVQDRIDASRNRISISLFDATYCARGLDCLYNYQKEYDEQAKVYKNNPKHDWSSHGSDSFGYSSLDDRDSSFAKDRWRSDGKPQFAMMDYNDLDN